MKRFLIECGVSQPSTQYAIALDVHGPSKNVNLRIDYISRTMLGKAFMDRLGTPVLEFALDENSQHIVFQGGHHLDGANFRVVEVLIENFRNAKMLIAAEN